MTADLDGSFELQEIGLLEEDLPRRDAKLPDLRLRQLDLLPWPRRPDLQQPVDDVVQQRRVHLRRRHRRNHQTLVFFFPSFLKP